MRKLLLILPLLLPIGGAAVTPATASMETADTPGPASAVVYPKEKREAFRIKALERCRKRHGGRAVTVEIDYSRTPPRSWCIKS